MMKKAILMKFLIPACLMATASAAELSPSDWVKAADTHRGLPGSWSMLVKVIVHDGSSQNEQGYQVSVRDFETSLIEQVSPERARGRKLLMKGLDMWLFTPQVKKAVRISLQQRLTGDVANGDISRTNYAQDYTAKVIGNDAQTDAIILDLKANDKRVTYDRIKYWIERKTQRPIKSEFYALNGKLLKTAVFSGFKKINGVDRMTLVTIQDAVVSTKRSELIYSAQKAETFPDGLFNKEQMDR